MKNRDFSFVKALKRILCILTVIAGSFCVVKSGEKVFQNKEGQKYDRFFSQREPYDVLFFGTSHVLNAIDPMRLWDKYGMVSYNMGCAGNRIPAIYWQIRLSLKQTTPGVVVIDCAYIGRDEKVNKQDGQVHKAFDAFPLSIEKTKAIFDLYEDRSHREAMLLPITVYHNRWNELTRDDFQPEQNKACGFSYHSGATPVSIPSLDMQKTVQEPESIGFEYLQKTVALCKEKNIEVLLTYLPYNYSEQSKADGIFVARFAEENGCRYISGNDFLAVLNQQTDFNSNADDNSHLNWSGAQKVTDYLGNYICQNYPDIVSDHRNDNDCDHWENDLREYTAYRQARIKKISLPEEVLVESYGSRIIVLEANSPESLRKIWDRYSPLLENIGADNQKMKDDTRLIILQEGRQMKTPDVPEEKSMKLEGVKIDLQEPTTEKDWLRIMLLNPESGTRKKMADKLFIFEEDGTIQQ